MGNICKLLSWIVLLTFILFPAHEGEADVSNVFKLRSGLGASDLADIAWDGEKVWVAGSGTLSKMMWGEGHLATDWISLNSMTGFGRGSMTALYASEDIMVLAWRYEVDIDEKLYNIGDGFSISLNNGENWRHIDVLELFPDRADWSYPGGETVSYDIAFSDGTLWCATTFGFLLKSDDYGYTWTNTIPDIEGNPDENADNINIANPNYWGVSICAYGDTVWVGTSQGMNVSFDRGKTWDNFSWPDEGFGDITKQWPGNFCVAVENKVVDGVNHVWVGSQPSLGKGLYGICHTDDNGVTWKYKTTKYNAWNFAFGHEGASDPAVSDSTVFAASDSGLVVSYDLGENWNIININESDNLYWETGYRVFGVLVVDDTLWATSSDGVARSTDWGKSWSISRGVTRVKTLDKGKLNVGVSSMFDDVKTYAFPNPFSPSRADRDYSRTRIQYALTEDAKITITIHDFSGRIIRELISGENRDGGRDYQEEWDGRDSNNTIVPNGVYYYIIKTNKGDSSRGKIMVID
ncbi:MAG: T9SS type A sorting domain-containing protein [Candidatus Latescibacteria bacterium]|nr:T9SS type A sorting domain-containing protein [Candidatus Latescibacterota bacterium]